MEPVAKEIKATEGLIERTRKRIEAIEQQLADPTLYEKEPQKATALAKERSDLSNALERHEDKWLTLSQEYEEGMAE